MLFHLARLGLTLLRAVGYLSREDLAMRPSGHAGPGLATPGAQCLGPHAFRVAFEPRGTAPSNNDLFARASSFVAPPHVIAAAGAPGDMPERTTFLTIEPVLGGCVLSACYKSEERDATVVRLFNADDKPAALRLATRRGVRRAILVNFLGERVVELPVREGLVELDLGPHKIVTCELD